MIFICLVALGFIVYYIHNTYAKYDLSDCVTFIDAGKNLKEFLNRVYGSKDIAFTSNYIPGEGLDVYAIYRHYPLETNPLKVKIVSLRYAEHYFRYYAEIDKKFDEFTEALFIENGRSQWSFSSARTVPELIREIRRKLLVPHIKYSFQLIQQEWNKEMSVMPDTPAKPLVR